MRCASLVLSALCIATVASSAQAAPGRRKSISSADAEGRENELHVDNGRPFDYARGLDSTRREHSATNGVQERLLKKTAFFNNVGKVSSSDESTSSDEEFHEGSRDERRDLSQSRPAVPGPVFKTAFHGAARVVGTPSSWKKGEPSFGKSRLEERVKKTENDASSGEDDPQGETANSIQNDDDDVYVLEQDGESPPDGNLVRTRRGVIFVPGAKTIPQVLDMSSSRCRYHQRLDRGHKLCRPVW